MEVAKLLEAAEEARKSSYSPYSGFAVGAALLADSGRVYLGCNIENSAYSLTICAERAAFAKALSEGERGFSAIAIVGGKDETSEPCYPCGACRQFMSEFCKGDFKLCFRDGDEIIELSFDEILPHRFSL